jgi:hypothetical protein
MTNPASSAAAQNEVVGQLMALTTLLSMVTDDHDDPL